MVCGGFRGQRSAVALAHCGNVAKASSGHARVRISSVGAALWVLSAVTTIGFLSDF